MPPTERVSFPMYLRPETAPVYDRLWQAVRDDLGAGPPRLNGSGDLWADWLSPDLLLSQTCGLPFRSRLKHRVTLVGTPDPGLPGLPPGHYQSVIVLRRDDPARSLAELAHRPLVINEDLSQSGWAALQGALASARVPPGPVQRSGSHAASAHAVAEGKADAAAIDRVTWNLLQAFDPVARDLRVLTTTPPVPGLPLITALDRDPAPLRAALSSAVARLDPDARSLIAFHRLVQLPASAYFTLPLPPAPPG